MFPGCLEKMVEVAEANSNVGIVGAYRIDEDKVNLDRLPYPSTCLPGKEICRMYFLENKFLFGSPSSILLRSDLIRQREKFYNEKNLHADLEVCIDLLENSDFGFVHQVLTYTRRHNETETSFAKYYKSHRIGDFIVLVKHGMKSLSPYEYKTVFKRRQKMYYRTLGKLLLQKKSKKIYEYHKKALGGNSIELIPVRVGLAMLTVVYNYLIEQCKIK
jgi:GT2 family glycosyltransferase